MATEVVVPGIHGVDRRMAKARILVDTNFPDLGTNPETQKAFKYFFEEIEFLPDDRIAVEQIARGRLNGSSGEIFGRANIEGEILPDQPVTVRPVGADPAIQKPH